MSLPVTVIQTSNKHSRAVLKNGVIEVRLAKRLLPWQRKQHIEELTARMQATAKKYVSKNLIDPWVKIIDERSGSIELVNGKTYNFELEAVSSKSVFVKQAGSQFNIKVGDEVTSAELKKYLWRLLNKVEKKYITNLVHHINNNTIKAKLANVSLQHLKSRWGSCSSNANIKLNTALLFTSEEILEYVIIHELCHRVHMNHSSDFWNLVEQHCPNYKDIKKEIKRFSL
jgi:predicted metal-dependent hydrolase